MRAGCALPLDPLVTLTMKHNLLTEFLLTRASPMLTLLLVFVTIWKHEWNFLTFFHSAWYHKCSFSNRKQTLLILLVYVLMLYCTAPSFPGKDKSRLTVTVCLSFWYSCLTVYYVGQFTNERLFWILNPFIPKATDGFVTGTSYWGKQNKTLRVFKLFLNSMLF